MGHTVSLFLDKGEYLICRLCTELIRGRVEAQYRINYYRLRRGRAGDDVLPGATRRFKQGMYDWNSRGSHHETSVE